MATILYMSLLRLNEGMLKLAVKKILHNLSDRVFLTLNHKIEKKIMPWQTRFSKNPLCLSTRYDSN